MQMLIALPVVKPVTSAVPVARCAIPGMGSLAICRFKFTESLIVIPMVKPTMFQKRLHLLVNSE